MNKRMLQKGSHHAILAIVLVVGLVGVLGFVGYNSWKKQSAGAAGISSLGRSGAVASTPSSSVNYDTYTFTGAQNVAEYCKNPKQVLTPGATAVLKVPNVNQTIHIYYDRGYDASSQSTIKADMSLSTSNGNGSYFHEFKLPSTVKQISIYKETAQVYREQITTIDTAFIAPCDQKPARCDVVAPTVKIGTKNVKIYTYKFEYKNVTSDSMLNQLLRVYLRKAGSDTLLASKNVQLVPGSANVYTVTINAPFENPTKILDTYAIATSDYSVGNSCNQEFSIASSNPVQTGPIRQPSPSS